MAFLTRPKLQRYVPPTVRTLFDEPPGMVPDEVADLWYLDGPLVYQNDDIKIIAPAGFLTDDASIPKIFDAIPFLDRQGLSRLPGLIHDAIYCLGREKGKAFADNILRQACIGEGMTEAQAWCIYQGVNLFGASAWKKNGLKTTYGPVTSSDFVSEHYYDAWKEAGGSIYS